MFETPADPEIYWILFILVNVAKHHQMVNCQVIETLYFEQAEQYKFTVEFLKKIEPTIWVGDKNSTNIFRTVVPCAFPGCVCDHGCWEAIMLLLWPYDWDMKVCCTWSCE
jgi:hypothetical protein